MCRALFHYIGFLLMITGLTIDIALVARQARRHGKYYFSGLQLLSTEPYGENLFAFQVQTILPLSRFRLYSTMSFH